MPCSKCAERRRLNAEQRKRVRGRTASQLHRQPPTDVDAGTGTSESVTRKAIDKP